MQIFNVHILGCGSALPTARHNSSAQVVEIREKMFLVDCSEGTQLFLRRSRIRFNRIQAVFISHLHGDHCFGLLGMISTFGLLGRTAALHIYAPADYERLFAEEIAFFCPHLEYEVVFHPVDTTRRAMLYEDRSLTVESIPLDHRMPCCGFLFKEKPGLRHIRRDMVDFYQVPLSQFNNLRAGQDWTTPEGETIANDRLTAPPDPTRSYAYCSDTRYLPQLAAELQGVTTLYHEATYAADGMKNAERYYHSTAAQAATTARDAKAGTLLIGHYSQRYESEQILLKEAREIFPNTLLTNEGMCFEVKV